MLPQNAKFRHCEMPSWPPCRVWLNFLAWLFSACIGFYIAPKGRRFVAAGGATRLFGVAEPVDSRFSILLPRRGKGDLIDSFTAATVEIPPPHPGRAYRILSPRVTLRRLCRLRSTRGYNPPPLWGEKRQANNNGNKVLHMAMNFNHTPPCRADKRIRGTTDHRFTRDRALQLYMVL
jgi:hypothetical protein